MNTEAIDMIHTGNFPIETVAVAPTAAAAERAARMKMAQQIKDLRRSDIFVKSVQREVPTQVTIAPASTEKVGLFGRKERVTSYRATAFTTVSVHSISEEMFVREKQNAKVNKMGKTYHLECYFLGGMPDVNSAVQMPEEITDFIINHPGINGRDKMIEALRFIVSHLPISIIDNEIGIVVLYSDTVGTGQAGRVVVRDGAAYYRPLLGRFDESDDTLLY